MKQPPNNHDHLWNDLPQDERHRLMPHMIEAQILHLWQTRNMIERGHDRTMKELNDQIKNLLNALPEQTSPNNETLKSDK